MKVIDTGYVAFQSTAGRIMLHLMREGDGQRTICGRYTTSHGGMLPENTDLPDFTPHCGVCTQTSDYYESRGI